MAGRAQLTHGQRIDHRRSRVLVRALALHLEARLVLDNDKLTPVLFLRLLLSERDYLAGDRCRSFCIADVVAVAPQAVPLNDSLVDHVHLNRRRNYVVRILFDYVWCI